MRGEERETSLAIEQAMEPWVVELSFETGSEDERLYAQCTWLAISATSADLALQRHLPSSQRISEGRSHRRA
jgi:hypothetical protein